MTHTTAWRGRQGRVKSLGIFEHAVPAPAWWVMVGVKAGALVKPRVSLVVRFQLWEGRSDPGAGSVESDLESRNLCGECAPMACVRRLPSRRLLESLPWKRTCVGSLERLMIWRSLQTGGL